MGSQPLPAWAYVDDKRTHEVRAAIRDGSPRAFVIRERALDGSDPADAYEETHVLAEPWEWRVHHLALETRLALLGRYHRATAGMPGWSPLAAPPPGRELDLAPLQLAGESARMQFHHYAKADTARATTLLGIPQPNERMGLARLDYSFPDVNGGNLRVIHAHLPLPVYRSVLAAQHLELGELGMRKVDRDAASDVYDERWWGALQACLDAILSRISEGRLGKPGDRRVASPLEVTMTKLEANALRKRTQGASVKTRTFETEDEIGLEHAQPVEAKKADVLLDDVPGDILAPLRDPRLHDIVSKYVSAADQDKLVMESDRAIREAMRRLRARTRPDQQHLVSLVEASLLVRAALKRKGAKIDMETLNTLKHAPAYL